MVFFILNFKSRGESTLNKPKYLTPYIKTLSGDKDTPITLYEKFVNDSTGFLLESKEPSRGRFSFIGKDPASIITGTGRDLTITSKDDEQKFTGNSLELIKEYLSTYKINHKNNLPFIGGAVGMVGYDIVKQHENLPTYNKDTLNLPDINLMVVTEVIIYDHLHSQIHIVALDENSETGRKNALLKINKMELEINTSVNVETSKTHNTCMSISNEYLNKPKEDFIEKVNKAKAYITEGDIFQVVISERWAIETNKSPFSLYRKLREINPSPYLFYFNYGNFQLAGSSPEMLVEVRDNHVYTCPIAGTRKRGQSTKEDKQLEHELITDEKERSEHVMLVDLARNDMGRVSQIGTVKVNEFMNVHYYSHVMHMVSTVEGLKNDSEDSFSILSHFLPAGTLSGAPKIRAMEIIEELEDKKRGPYGGAIGYFGFDGDLDMCIAIRTMLIKEDKVFLQAGAGIVADSIPEKEFEECRNKIQSLVHAIEIC